MDTELAAKLVAISTPMLMAGYGIKASQTSLPLLYGQPAAISTPMFATIFHKGTAVMAPGAVLGATACAYLAYAHPSQRARWITAGILAVSIGPFTSVVMKGGIDRLLDLSKAAATEQLKAEKSGEVLNLLQAWNGQNRVRVVLNFAAGFLALWTSLTIPV